MTPSDVAMGKLLTIVVGWLTLNAFWSGASFAGQGWLVDEIGFEYRDAIEDGIVKRQYREPERWAVSWTVYQHLPELGLPDPRPKFPPSGVDGRGRHWQRDGLGFAYYWETRFGERTPVYYYARERHVAGQVHEFLSRTDWKSAVRTGTRNVVARGFNRGGANSTAAADPTPQWVRLAVQQALVQGLNATGADPSAAKATLFQEAITAGVEDATIQAFNELQSASKRATGADGYEPELRRHFSCAISRREFDARYASWSTTSTGWAVGKFGLRVLHSPAGYVSLRRHGSDRLEIWSEGRLLYRDCLLCEFQEDALEAQAGWETRP